MAHFHLQYAPYRNSEGADFKNLIKMVHVSIAGMQTAKLRAAYNVNVLQAPYLIPTHFVASPNSHGAVKISLKEILCRLMQHDKPFRQAVIAASDEWKLGLLHNKKADVLRDITDGDKCACPHARPHSTSL